MKYLENEDFKEEVKEGKVLVDFYADWCGPCKMLGEVIEEVSQEMDIKIVKVNVDKHADLAREFGIMSIPYIVLYENGEAKRSNLGFMMKEDLKKFIEG